MSSLLFAISTKASFISSNRLPRLANGLDRRDSAGVAGRVGGSTDIVGRRRLANTVARRRLVDVKDSRKLAHMVAR